MQFSGVRSSDWGLHHCHESLQCGPRHQPVISVGHLATLALCAVSSALSRATGCETIFISSLSQRSDWLGSQQYVYNVMMWLALPIICSSRLSVLYNCTARAHTATSHSLDKFPLLPLCQDANFLGLSLLGETFSLKTSQLFSDLCALLGSPLPGGRAEPRWRGQSLLPSSRRLPRSTWCTALTWAGTGTRSTPSKFPSSNFFKIP